jgi:serine/threonine protein kinase
MSMRLGANQTHVSNVHHGTPLYIAPEVLHKAQAARAADVYSFGVLLWELWHGRTAWEQLLRMTEHRPAGRGMAYVPGLFGFEDDAANAVLPGYAELATKCLSSKPAERPSFAEIETALEVSWVVHWGLHLPCRLQ